ncbi:MAG TPA: hypothetical protein VNS55_12075 [Nocardioides sp.]|nr:hypothetical protein [Nocardioides sp.]
MIRSRLLVAIVAWVVVVAGASTLVWAVISRAGQQVVSSDPSVPTTTAGSARHPATRSSHAPSRTPTPSTTAPTVERRTWQGQGGLLVAECQAGAVSLVSTQPQVGFHAEVKKSGPEELEVEFDGREDDAGTNVTVTARCVDGVPTFAAQVEGGEDD